jgi:hypothetical protein
MLLKNDNIAGENMGSTRKGMLNVLIAAVLWGSSGVCAQYIMEKSHISSPYLTMVRLLFTGVILLTLSFVHGDKIFSVIKHRKDALSLLIFSLVGALTVQLTFLLTIEKSNAATATVLQFLSPTIIVAWFALARKKRPGVFVLSAIDVACRDVPAGHPRRPDLALHLACRAVLRHRLGVCRRVLHHLSVNADRPLRHAADCRLEYVDCRVNADAVLRRARDHLCD